VFLSLVFGAVYYAEMRYGFLRLREIEVTSGDVVPEEVIWQALPKDASVFWPSLMFGSGDFEKSIMNYYPVSVKLSVSGWGKYRMTISPLDIFIAVSWNKKMWWLSADGRMWLATLPASAEVKSLNYPNRPILAWDSRLPLPIDPEHQMGDIYPSSLPIEKIKKWYDTIEMIDWNKDIYCLFAKKIDGRQVVQILLGSEERITGDIVVKEDASDWLSLAAALDNIYPRASGGVPPGLTINATFSDAEFIVSEKGTM
jgi:hypothetical protein